MPMWRLQRITKGGGEWSMSASQFASSTRNSRSLAGCWLVRLVRSLGSVSEFEEQLVDAVEQIFPTALPGGFLPERMMDVTPEK